jgi:hypothetical protein
VAVDPRVEAGVKAFLEVEVRVVGEGEARA